MTTSRFPYTLATLCFIFLMLTAGFIFISAKRYQKEIPFTNERELKVDLEAGFGDIMISRGKSYEILYADVETELDQELSQFIHYIIRDGVGYLDINTTNPLWNNSHKKHRRHSFDIRGLESNSWDLRFTNSAPISFDIELGLGKGDLDFTGLKVKDLNLSTGASSVVMRFDKPNRAIIDDLTIETGLSKFRGRGLMNANFNHFKFQGGLGAYSLDFSGKLDREVDIDIEVGLGTLTVLIPHKIGVKVIYEKSFLSPIDLARDFSEEEENHYLSSNYYSARGKVNMMIEAGCGSVKIKRE